MEVGLYSVKRKLSTVFFSKLKFLSVLENAVQSIAPDGIAGQTIGKNTNQRFRMIFVEFHHGQCV